MSKNGIVLEHVNRYSTDAEVRAELCAMLGLLNADGTLAEDESRLMSMAELNKGGGVVKTRDTEAWFLDKPDVSTAPEALRNLAPVVVEPKAKAAPKPAKVKKQQPTKKARIRPPSGTRCGTLRGFDDHVHYGETKCQPCRDVYAAHRLKKRHAKRLADTGTVPAARAEAVCGSRFGERKHRRRGEPVCDPCRLAHNIESARRRRLARARKKAQ